MNRTVFLILLMYVLLLLGLTTLQGPFIALTIPCALYLLLAFIYRPQKLALTVMRTLSSDHASQAMPVSVTLSVANHGSKVEELFIEDHVPPGLTVCQGKPALFTTLRPEETIRFDYQVQGTRGSFNFGPVHIKGSDHLALFRRRLFRSAPARLLILPDIPRFQRVATRPLRTRFYTGPNPSRHGGSGTDFLGVRHYQPGDPVRWINWKISARHQKTLFTNEFESERIADIGLILDARERNNIRISNDSLFNHSIRATASLAEAFLKDGNRVSLLVYGKTLQRTFPGYGKMQRERILNALAQAEPGHSEIFSSLNYLPTRFFPAKSQLVFISPLCRSDLPILVQLRAFGYHLLVISPDPVAFEGAYTSSTPENALACRMATIERTLLLSRLRRSGIIVVDWAVTTPLDQTVFASLSRLPHWFRAMETAV
jgi:uncharacterized protein (DUF58 family)